MTRLILIRHGETDYSLKGRYCGFSNPSLNKSGIWQSKKLADRLTDIKIQKVYSSDLKRAVETAKIIFKNNSIEQLSDFREMNFGILEGLNYNEIIKRYPRLYRDWIDNPLKVKIPKGESLKDLSIRVKKGLSSILFIHQGETLVLVSHGGPIRIVLCEALRFDLKMFWQIKQEVGALNIIDYPRASSPVMVRMNDTAHLITKEAAAV